MAGRDDRKLRADRLVFYKNDVERIDRILREFLKSSDSKCALLVDKDGHLVAKVGQTESYDTDTISALVAGSFAATKEMAKILGEQEFSVLFHQGKKDSIQLSLIADRALLTVIFDEKTTIGMVRLYATETAGRLTKIFKEIQERKGAPPQGVEEEAISGDFEATAKEKLDQLFGVE